MTARSTHLLVTKIGWPRHGGPSGKRAKLSEIVIYTVKEGRIVREEFLPHAESEG